MSTIHWLGGSPILLWAAEPLRPLRGFGKTPTVDVLAQTLAHRAFFLNDEKKDRAVAMREVLKALEAEKGDCHAGRGAASFRSKADPQLDIPEKVGIGLARGSCIDKL